MPEALVPLMQMMVTEPPPRIAPPIPEIPTAYGLRSELSVFTRMSNPLRVAEFCMSTATVREPPADPVKTVPVGQDPEPWGAMHTVPTKADP